MTSQWLEPRIEPTRPTTVAERARLLIDVLDLVDALPPAPRRPLEAPTFKQLCGHA